MDRRLFLKSLSIIASPVAVGCVSDTTSTTELNSYSTSNVKSKAVDIGYSDLMRNIDSYENAAVHLTGEVNQVLENDEIFTFNVAIGKLDNLDMWDPSKNVFVLWDGQRFIEGDVIEFWGVVEGLEEYQTVLGAESNAPRITAVDIQIQDSEGSQSSTESTESQSEEDSDDLEVTHELVKERDTSSKIDADDPFSAVYVEGTVTNNSDYTTYRFVEVRVVLYGEGDFDRKEEIGQGSTATSYLEPGETWSYQVDLDSELGPDIVDYEVSVLTGQF